MLLKHFERLRPMLQVRFARVGAQLEAIGQDTPPKLTLMRCQIVVDRSGRDQRLDLLLRYILSPRRILNIRAEAVLAMGEPARRRSNPRSAVTG